MGLAQAHSIRHLQIAPGRPTQNGYIGSFNGVFRDECLNELRLDDAARQAEYHGLASGLPRGQPHDSGKAGPLSGNLSLAILARQSG